MTTHARLWWSVVLLVAAFGLVEALLALPSYVAWAAGTAGAAVGFVWCFTVPSRRTGPPPPGVLLPAACRGAGIGVVMAGLSVLPGGLPTAILLAAFGLHPRVVSAVRGWVRRLRQPRPTSAPTAEVERPSSDVVRRPTAPRTDPDAAAVRLLSTSQLCWGWRTSFRALERAHAGADHLGRAALVDLRQRYLDEIDRRDPAGFARWLYSGARPASDPSRFLLPARTPTTAQPGAPEPV